VRCTHRAFTLFILLCSPAATAGSGGAMPYMEPQGGGTIREFFDYACIPCRLADSDVRSAAQSARVNLIYMEYPVFGPGSVLAARAAVAARIQGRYPEMHHALFSLNVPLTPDSIDVAADRAGLDIAKLHGDMKSEAVIREVDMDIRSGRAEKVAGTPTFIANGSRRLLGYDNKEELAEFFRQALP
jgi:protein-disulfide isomerase